MNFGYMPNRTVCAVLEEMRSILTKLDMHNLKQGVSVLSVLVEEVQSLGNRMEAALYDKNDFHSLHDDIKKAKKELKKLEDAVESGKEDSDEQRCEDTGITSECCSSGVCLNDDCSCGDDCVSSLSKTTNNGYICRTSSEVRIDLDNALLEEDSCDLGREYHSYTDVDCCGGCHD